MANCAIFSTFVAVLDIIEIYKRRVIAVVLLASNAYAAAMPDAEIDVPSDTAVSMTMVADSVTVKKPGLIQRVIDYFTDANKEHPDKAFDISFIGGPEYSSETGFGVGIIGSGLYTAGKQWRTDTVTPKSNVSLKFEVATHQYYKGGAEGIHIFPKDRMRLIYDTYFYSFKDKMWGVGYDMGSDDANESVFKRLEARVKLDYVVRLGPNMFLGPSGMFTYANARRVDNPELLCGQKDKIYTTGLGLTLLLDSRDFAPNAYRGVYVKVDQVFNPSFMGNKYAFSYTEAIAAVYCRAWRGAVIAPMVHARFTYGDTPWSMMSTFGGSHYMRGYYEGRYRDKCVMDATVEFRQHVWGRNGIVVWLGAGTIFPNFAALRLDRVLPNGGIGYRWEFKKRVNVRLDVGFGRGEKGVNFSINEAF